MPDVRDQIAQINSLARGFMNSQVLFAANEAGVFACIEEPRTAEEVAAQCGWEPRAARMLLDALVALGLAGKTDGRYRNTALASACLVPGQRGYQGHIVAHLQDTMAGWLHLADALRTGTGVEPDRSERSPEEVRSFILGMKDIARTSAQEVLNAVEVSPYKHLLDVGAGPATYTIAFLQAHPRMKATVFDRPEVIQHAREQVEFAEVGQRVKFVSGDLTKDAFGADYDLVLVSNTIHSFGPDANRRFIRKCYDAMCPGGLLIIKDFLVANDRSGPAFSLMFALHMLVATGEGDAYTIAQVEEWTREAGFEDGRVIDLTPQSRLWLTKKPFPAYRSSLIGFLDKEPPKGAPAPEFPTE